MIVDAELHQMHVLPDVVDRLDVGDAADRGRGVDGLRSSGQYVLRTEIDIIVLELG